MFGIFDKKPQVKGEIGYFGLQDWWLSTFTQEERNHIEEIGILKDNKFEGKEEVQKFK